MGKEERSAQEAKQELVSEVDWRPCLPGEHCLKLLAGDAKAWRVCCISEFLLFSLELVMSTFRSNDWSTGII